MSSKFKIEKDKWSNNINAVALVHRLNELDFDGPIKIINDKLSTTQKIYEMGYTTKNASLKKAAEKTSKIHSYASRIEEDIHNTIDKRFFDAYNDNEGVLETLENIVVSEYEVSNDIGIIDSYIDTTYGEKHPIKVEKKKKKIGFKDFFKESGELNNGTDLPTFRDLHKSKYGGAYAEYAKQIDQMNKNRQEDHQIKKMSYDDFVKQQLARTDITHTKDGGWLANLGRDIANLAVVGIFYSMVTGQKPFTGENLTNREKGDLLGNLLVTVGSYAFFAVTYGTTGGLAVAAKRVGADMFAGSLGLTTTAVLKERGAPNWISDLAGITTAMYSGHKLNKWVTYKASVSTGPGTEDIPKRPSWRESEIDVGKDYKNYESQKSFKDGKEVPYGTKGSTRPEYYTNNHSVEVKNYNVETSSGRNNLVNNVSKQIDGRVANLPSGTKQTIVIDVRGQTVTNDILKEIKQKILDKTGVDVEIIFKKGK